MVTFLMKLIRLFYAIHVKAVAEYFTYAFDFAPNDYLIVGIQFDYDLLLFFGLDIAHNRAEHMLIVILSRSDGDVLAVAVYGAEITFDFDIFVLVPRRSIHRRVCL